MSGLMFAQMGLSIAQGLGSFHSASVRSKMAKGVQEFKNTMSALTAAQSTNAITLNENAALEASDAQRQLQQITALKQEGSAAVASGAAGVTGTTSELIVKNLQGNAARANKARLDSLESQFIAYAHERKNVELGRIYNKDVSVIPRPSAASAMLGIGTNLLGIYDSHQPPGETIADRLAD